VKAAAISQCSLTGGNRSNIISWLAAIESVSAQWPSAVGGGNG